jgi:hypothetical protein
MSCLSAVDDHYRNAYRILVGKPEGKWPLGRPRRRWVDNIKMDLREIGWDGMDWIYLAQDRDRWRALVNTNEPSGSIKCWVYFLSGCAIGSFWRRAQLHEWVSDDHYKCDLEFNIFYLRLRNWKKFAVALKSTKNHSQNGRNPTGISTGHLPGWSLDICW